MSMKKWIRAAAALAAVMVLGSCTAGTEEKAGWTVQEAADSFSRGFSSQADIRMEDMEMKAEISREGERTLILITSPEHLEGLTFSVKNGTAEVGYKGLLTVAEEMPASGLGRAVALVADALTHSELLTASAAENGGTAFTGRTENGAFIVTMGEKVPVSAELPQLDLIISFSEFEFSPSAQLESEKLPPSSVEEGGSSIPGESSETSSQDGEDVSSLQQGAEDVIISENAVSGSEG